MLLLSRIAVVASKLTVVREGDKEGHLSFWYCNSPRECRGVFDLIWFGGIDITGACLGCTLLTRWLYRRNTSQDFRLLYLLLRCIGWLGLRRAGTGCSGKCNTQCQGCYNFFGRIGGFLFIRFLYFHQILLYIVSDTIAHFRLFYNATAVAQTKKTLLSSPLPPHYPSALPSR